MLCNLHAISRYSLDVFRLHECMRQVADAASGVLPGGLMSPVLAVGDALAAKLRGAGVVLTSRRG